MRVTLPARRRGHHRDPALHVRNSCRRQILCLRREHCPRPAMRCKRVYLAAVQRLVSASIWVLHDREIFTHQRKRRELLTCLTEWPRHVLERARRECVEHPTGRCERRMSPVRQTLSVLELCSSQRVMPSRNVVDHVLAQGIRVARQERPRLRRGSCASSIHVARLGAASSLPRACINLCRSMIPPGGR